MCPCNLIILDAVVGLPQRTESYHEELSRGIDFNDGHAIPVWNDYQHHRTGQGFVFIYVLLYLLLGVGVYLTSLKKKMQVTNPETSHTHDQGRCAMYCILLLFHNYWQYTMFVLPQYSHCESLITFHPIQYYILSENLASEKFVLPGDLLVVLPVV